jgi:eukaryotic translation initiation factor 2C
MSGMAIPHRPENLLFRSTEDIEQYGVPFESVPRPGFNTTGTEVELSINAYPISKYPSRSIYQYDVSI